MPHFMIVLISYINLLNLPSLDKNVYFEEFGAFKELIIITETAKRFVFILQRN